MKLSIIIPTLNEEKNLSFLLGLVAKEDIKDYEIIVADAGSKDRTKRVAQDFGCKITSGGTPARGRNDGAKIAQGDLLLFLDADLRLSKDFFNNSLKELKQRGLGIASYCITPRTNNLPFKFIYNLLYNWPIVILQGILAHGAMGILVEKKIFEKVGGFDEEIILAEDQHFTRQCAKLVKFGILNSARIYAPMRRFEKDGYLKTIFTYAVCAIYMIFKGPVKTPFLTYDFDHYDDAKKTKK